MVDISANMPENSDRKPRIGDGAAAFAVCDRSLTESSAEFYQWLRQNGFKKWDKVPFRNQAHVWVNVNNKMFAYGMPGIPVTKPIGNCVMSIEDFMTIYDVLERCDGQTVWSMSRKWQ